MCGSTAARRSRRRSISVRVRSSASSWIRRAGSRTATLPTTCGRAAHLLRLALRARAAGRHVSDAEARHHRTNSDFDAERAENAENAANTLGTRLTPKLHHLRLRFVLVNGLGKRTASRGRLPRITRSRYEQRCL